VNRDILGKFFLHDGLQCGVGHQHLSNCYIWADHNFVWISWINWSAGAFS